MALLSSICYRKSVNKGRWENRKGTADLTSGQPSRPRGGFLLFVLQLAFEILNLATVPFDQCLGINNLFLRGVQLKEVPDAINDRATATGYMRLT